MFRLAVIFVYLNIVLCDDTKVVKLDYGIVSGEKYWNGDFYEFYGVPYASIPTGRDRFKGPLPPKPWDGVLTATKKSKICHQCYFSGDDEQLMLDGDEDCLLINVLTPLLASEDNLLPVVVYIHSGAYSGGSGNMAIFHYLARHDVVTVSFNYRLGAFGFLCLGNEEIPGNAGLKDQVAALRWIQDNIKKFGGDPKRVTLAGFSVGAAMAELLSFSKSTIGLFNKLILESGSAFSPFSINRDPIATARNIAYSIGYNGTEGIEELTEFYLNAEVKALAEKSVNYHLKNSTFGFAPCIENLYEGMEAILLESPTDVIKKGEQNDVTILTGFANMEGISRTVKFGTWREEMNENFSDFLPADLKFDSDKSKDDFIKAIKQRYFNNKEISVESLQNYVDYFSDSMFKYSIMKSAKSHAALSKKPVYLYEFSYLGKLNIEHKYMDRLKGASHRDQTAYVLDFFGSTNNYKDLDMRERMTTMWTDFVKYENPTPFESSLITVRWLPYTNQKRNYLEINRKMQPKTNLFEDTYNFWNNIYEKYYWNPQSPRFVKIDKKKNDSKSQIGDKPKNEDKSYSTSSNIKSNIKSENEVHPKKDITNVNIQPKNIVQSDNGVNLNDAVKTNDQYEEDIKSKIDVKLNKDGEINNDVKPKGDDNINSGNKPNTHKPKSDEKSNDNIQTKSDIKKSNDDKPKIVTVSFNNGIESKNRLNSNNEDQPNKDIKPNSNVKSNNNVQPVQNAKTKSDGKADNNEKPKIVVKSSSVEPNNVVSPKSEAQVNRDIKPKSDKKVNNDNKPKIVAKANDDVKSKNGLKPNNVGQPNEDIKPNGNVKPHRIAQSVNNDQSKSEPNTVRPKSDDKSNNDIKSSSDVRPKDDINSKNKITTSQKK